MIATGQPQILDTVLLKVASRCNLDCSYCYVYNMGDDGWKSQPKRMAPSVMRRVATALGNQFRLQQQAFSVVLHGGEPLLLGHAGLDDLCAVLRTELPHPCGIHLQTNAVLLDDAMLDILVRYDVGISISLDGPAAVHDRFRTDHGGRGSHARVLRAIDRINAREDVRPLFAGILAVVDPTSDPVEIYNALKATGAPSLDFLVRDGNWDALPFGKVGPASTEYGEWLEALLHHYLSDPAPPRIRLLDDMLRLLLGGVSQKEGIGSADYGILVIEPDGRIDKNDTLKVAHAEADRFAVDWSVETHAISEIFKSAAYREYFAQQRPSSNICQSCPDLAVCGGGMVAHRWSKKSGFDNPTIFCADQRYLIAAMREALQDAAKAA